ncbi:MAG TPA: ABC transporter permease [Promineifilum sp.]|nr:ABC transporter permease [Promineifilum sp.]HRO23262.1 ABC transporter permease [Promineifilum sp.]HRO89898.1 ABC transporter permease [Promineifilum sp.]HRQ12719.1 ABC transporter permease [Promineifilum sp.]
MELTASRRNGSISWLVKNKWLTLIAIIVTGSIIFAYATNDVVTIAVLARTIRESTPLILGALCGLLGERSGVVNIGIEGQMLIAAFIAFLANVYTGNLVLAIIIGALAGALLGAFLAFMAVTLKMDQIIGGTIINILAVGLTGYFYVAGLTTRGKLQPISLGPLADIPLIGPVLFKNPPITYLAIILVFVVHYVLFYTRWGLRTRAVGEHPSAADTVGINVYKVRYINVILGGAIAGLGGAYLTLEGVGSFERMMTNGRGFLALAILIFGKWTPFGAWGAALLFGFTYALQTQLQFWGVNLPPQFIGSMPYILTILVLAGFVGRSRAPAASGVPYEKG